MNELIVAKTDIDHIRSNLAQVFAIELLEYHDKNHLSGDNKTRNEVKRFLLSECIQIIAAVTNTRSL